MMGMSRVQFIQGTYRDRLMEEVDFLFTYHAPHGDQVERYQRIREAAKQFAQVLIETVHTDPSWCPPLLREAIDHIDMAVMQANAAIARGEADK